MAIADALSADELPWAWAAVGDRHPSDPETNAASPPLTSSTCGAALVTCSQAVLEQAQFGSSFVLNPAFQKRFSHIPTAAAITYLPALLCHQRSPLRSTADHALGLQEQGMTVAWYAHQLVLGWLQMVSERQEAFSPSTAVAGLRWHCRQLSSSILRINRAESANSPDSPIDLALLWDALAQLTDWIEQPSRISTPIGPNPQQDDPLLSLIWAMYFSLTAAENYPVAVGRALRLRHSLPLITQLTGLFSGILASSTGLPPLWLTPILAETNPSLTTRWGLSVSGALRQLPDQLYAAWIGTDYPYPVRQTTASWSLTFPVVHR